MTDNISRMYELAKVEKVGKKLSCSLLDFGACKNINCSFCDKAQDKNYPPFTAEKQLELIKCITRLKGEFALNFYEYTNVWVCNTDKKWEMHETYYEHTDFSQALAGLVCELWEDLTDTQREEVRGILQ